MKIIVFILFSIGIVKAQAQVATISVLGNAEFIEEAKTGCIVLRVNKNIKNSISVLQLIESLNLQYLNTDIYGNSRYLYTTEFEDTLQNKIMQIGQSNFDVEQVYYEYNDHNFRDEDSRALKSIENATNLARKLAEEIGYEIKGVLNIDDVVERNENADWFTCTPQDFEQFLISEGFTIMDVDIIPYPTHSKSRFRKSDYKTWVTFEIEKK
jgi:hypothetical protein